MPLDRDPLPPAGLVRRHHLIRSAKLAVTNVTRKAGSLGTYICIQGPRVSTAMIEPEPNRRRPRASS